MAKSGDSGCKTELGSWRTMLNGGPITLQEQYDDNSNESYSA